MKIHVPLFLPVAVLAILLSATSVVRAQLFVDGSVSPDVMVEDFFGGTCVEVSNISWVTNDTAAQMGFFEGSASNVGLNAGILLTSGNIQNAIGPNNNGSISSFANGPGDEDINAALGTFGISTYDACVLEFDVTSLDEDTLYFEYVFGSEEYEEFVGSGFNDAFAFFVSGPGYEPNTNIALVPGTDIPVAINNVNMIDNTDYYVNNGDGSAPPYNADSTFVQYDGLTTVLAAPMYVIPGQTYHVKLVVADVMDGVLDSGVFIGIESLCGGPELPPVTEFAYFVATDGSYTVAFENDTRYATSWAWDFGDGTTSTARHPAPHTFSEAGTYTVRLSAANYCCTSVYTQEITVGSTATSVQTAPEAVQFYPNPVSSTLQVQVNTPNVELQLFNANGQLALQQNLSHSVAIDVSQLPKGLYIARLTGNNNTWHRRLVVR